MRFRNKLFGIIISAAVALSSCAGVAVFADTGISVYVDGLRVTFDEEPRIEDDRTLVPMRGIFEALGADVKWDEKTETASATLGDTTVSLTIDDNIMKKNDEIIELEVPARIFGERTLVPVRAVSEAFGSYVDWDEATQTVFVDSKENPLQGAVVTDEYRYRNYDGEYGGIHIFDNSSDFFGMELLNITDEQGISYAETINAFADAAPGANVYNLIAPTAAEFYASNDMRTHYTAAFRKIYSQLSDRVTGVNAVSNLMNHADENIYFHTDHHWTQLGAYYAYEAFINAAGDDIDPYYTFDTTNIYGYNGSLATFTSGTAGYNMLTQSSDLLQLFSPKVWYNGKSYNDMYMTDFIKDMRILNPDFRNYSCFIEGDYPIEVYSTGVENGRSLVIVKESYGNAFSTWAINNFQTVYIVDYRKFNNYGGSGEYTNEFKMSEFYDLTGFTDLLVISYPVTISNTPESSALKAMAQ